MSKSITGNGSLNLTLNELRLLEIKSSNVESTNATISNALTVQGTLTANNFSITGTFALTNLEATGLIDAFNVDVENQLLYKTEDTDARYARKSGNVNETITGTKSIDAIVSNSITYNSEELDTRFLKITSNAYVKTTSPQTILGIKTFSDNAVFSSNVNVGGTLSKGGDAIKTQVENDNRYIQLSTTDFSITNLTASGFLKISNTINEASISTPRPLLFLNGDNKVSVNSNLSFVPSSAKINASSISVTGNIEGNNIKLNSMVSPSTGTSVEYPLLFHGFNNHIQKASSGLTYNNSSNTLSVENIKATSLLSPDTTTDVEHKILFLGENDHIQKSTNTLSFNNSNDTITCNNYVGTNLTISNELSFNAKNSTISRQQRILFYDITDDYTKSSTVFTFNPSSKILSVGNINLTESEIEIPNPVDIGTANRECNLMIHDGATGGDNVLKIANNKLSYNGSSNGVLSCPNLRITSMGAYGADQDRPIPYLNNINKLVKSTNLTFNGSSNTIKVSNIETDSIKCPLTAVDSSVTDSFPLVILNTNSNALKKIGTTVDGYYNQTNNQFGMTNLTIATELKYKNQDIDSRYIQTGTDQIITNKYTFTKLNLDALPIMYTELIESDDTLTLHSSYNSSNPSDGTVAGRWGNGNGNDTYMSFKYNDTGVTHSQFSPSHYTSTTYSKWLWQTQLTAQSGVPITYIIDDAYFGQYFYLYNNGTDSSNLNGSCWQIDISMRFKNNSSNRVAPSAILVREIANGTKTEYPCSEGTGYIRTGLAKFHTVRLNVLVDNCQTTDKFYIKLTCARGSATVFQSILNVNDWRIQYYKQQFTYKGNMTSGTTTNPRTVELSGGGG